MYVIMRNKSKLKVQRPLERKKFNIKNIDISNKLRDTQCLRIKRLIIKMSIFLKLVNLMLWQLSLDFKMYRETTKSEHKKFEEEK